jgi:CDP-glucose 4,6-dehydratase
MENLVMSTLFKGIYQQKKVLLTGHTGFKGSWLQLWLQQLGAKVTGLSLAPNTSPSHFELLEPTGISTIADIRDASAVKKTVAACQPDIIFHLAAQPLVRRSYADPVETFHTNIIGTINLFEAIRNTPTVKAVVNVTTDKVYRNLESKAAFKESDVLGGHDPYSTSKACVELVHESYFKSFFKDAGIFAATARAGNVIGGGDWAEDRLVPDLMKAASNKKPADIRNPQSVRPWQHVLDPLSGYLLLGQYLLQQNDVAEDAWNFGPAIEDCLDVASMINLLNKYWDEIRWNDASNEKQLHESNVLRLDCSKAREKLGWLPTWNINTAIERTAAWYAAYYTKGTVITKQDLYQYISDAASSHAVWAS